MIAEPFQYHRAANLDEALQLLQELGDEAKLLAGGHSLIPAMKLRLTAPAHLIDIGHLTDLKYIRAEGDTLAIGATATHWMIASSDLIRAKMPMLSEAAGLIGDVQVRNKGTLGGSLAHADPAADYPAPLLATSAQIVVQGPDGKRTIPAQNYFIDLYLTNLKRGEIITEVRFPILHEASGSAYTKFMQPASRFAVVGCAAVVSVTSGIFSAVKVAFNGVSNAAFLDNKVAQALVGQPTTPEAIAAAASHAAEEAEDVLDDLYASEQYRIAMAQVCAKRSLIQALATT